MKSFVPTVDLVTGAAGGTAPAPTRAKPSPGPARRVSPAAERHLPLQDSERLGALFDSLRPRLLGVAQRYTRDRAAAEDVVQGAFEKALRHGERFRGNARVSTWLHRIVANEALMWLRAERRRAARFLPHGATDVETAAEPESTLRTVVGRQRFEQVCRGLSQLQPGEREVLLRCAFDPCSYHELGARIGVHPAALKTRAFRARRRLTALLEKS